MKLQILDQATTDLIEGYGFYEDLVFKPNGFANHSEGLLRRSYPGKNVAIKP